MVLIRLLSVFCWTISLILSAHAFEETSSTSLCVYNQSDVELFFVVRTNDAVRTTKTLSTGEVLCLHGTNVHQPGTVAVFEDPFALEGCTRLAKAGDVHTLIDYSSFDNCTWQNIP